MPPPTATTTGRSSRTLPRVLTDLNQLWVADITYIAIATGFVYLAAILDAWSRRVVGYAISKRIDARLALAALRTAIAARQPPPGCIHHSDRGSQYAAEDYRRSDTRAPSSLRRNTPGRWPIERHHSCPLQGVHFTEGPKLTRCQPGKEISCHCLALGNFTAAGSMWTHG